MKVLAFKTNINKLFSAVYFKKLESDTKATSPAD
jgi:hypothetical protein